jgi:hypothetical protein
MNTIEGWSKKVLTALALDEEIEIPVGQGFEFFGTLLVPVTHDDSDQDACEKCFMDGPCHSCGRFICTRIDRKDNTSVYFVEGKVTPKNP